MSSFFTAVNAVAPMFLMLTLGWFLRRIGFLGEHTLKDLNKLCFKVFIPLNVYYNICNVDLAAVFQPRLLLWSIATMAIVFVLSILTALPVERGKKRRGALAHCIFHANFVIFGTLIGTSLCGEGNIGVISLLIAVVVPVQNVLSVILLEASREGGGRVDAKELAISVLKNPFVIAAFAGFATQLVGLRWPSFLSTTFRDLGRCGTPAALIAMGGLFNFGTVGANLRTILIGCAVRLIVLPALLIAPIFALGFRGAEFVGLMCIFISPIATSSFNLATQLDSDGDLTSQLVVFSSAFCLVTVFLWIWFLGGLGAF